MLELAGFKEYLRGTPASDDALLTKLLKAAEIEAIRFMNRNTLPNREYESEFDSECESETSDDDYSDTPPVSEDDVPEDVVIACYLLAQAKYESKDAAEIDAVRESAFNILQPYRVKLGV